MANLDIAPKPPRLQLLPMKPKTFQVQAHFYCGLMGEAIHAIFRAHLLQQEALQIQREGNDSHEGAALLADAGLFARYAFLLACNALENSAYSILARCGKLSPSLVTDLDRLNTINKFEVFALIHGKAIDRGDKRYEKLKHAIKCRNDFVHPKELFVPIHPDSDRAEAKVVGERTYPMAFEFLEIEQAASMIGDILQFVAWVVFDVCHFGPGEGATLINGGTKWWIMAFHDANELWGYDLRSLGNFDDIKVRTIELPPSKRRPCVRKRKRPIK